MSVLVLLGTRKGLFLLEGDEARREWELEGPFLTGWSVFHAVLDTRDGTIHAATNNEVYGATVHRSSDRGAAWTRSEELGLPEDSGLTLEKTWHVEPGRDGEDGRLWLGAAPGVLFGTDDGGESWAPVEGILRHETRDRWFPGAGGMCCHSIQLDPEEPERMYVGISAAGVFRTDDGGESWTPANKGTAADFLPEPWVEVGQCVHKLLLHPGRAGRLWQQNHCGVYRTDDRGESWERLEGNGLPSG
ncbi:MAG: WD40/YVTN/BNR-like repeat-containing protein, partial [Gaiellaceae bacterium]